MSDAIESVERNVMEIFAGLVGDRSKRLDGSVVATPAMDAIAGALAGEYGAEKAADIGFHMADWNWDAAFIVALHLFPERFTPEEINAGLGLFLMHAPHHIREACRLTGHFGWVSFSDDDEASPGQES